MYNESIIVRSCIWPCLHRVSLLTTMSVRLQNSRYKLNNIIVCYISIYMIGEWYDHIIYSSSEGFRELARYLRVNHSDLYLAMSLKSTGSVRLPNTSSMTILRPVLHFLLYVNKHRRVVRRCHSTSVRF